MLGGLIEASQPGFVMCSVCSCPSFHWIWATDFGRRIVSILLVHKLSFGEIKWLPRDLTLRETRT